MWEFVDKVVYINLDERTDRRNHMEKMTKTFGDKVIRFPAIRHSPGNIGASKSHIAVLKMALENDWKNVLILEDDAEWNDFYVGYGKLKTLVQSDYDAILLGGTAVRYYPHNHKLVNAQCGTAYLVNGHYIKTILACFEEALPKLIETGNGPLYALDMYWKPMQERDNWFVIMPPMVYQVPGYSDIENMEVDYMAFFGVTPKQVNKLSRFPIRK
jgi:hypothetical protein